MGALLERTTLQGGLDLLCVALEVLRLNVPVLSAKIQVTESQHNEALSKCLHKIPHKKTGHFNYDYINQIIVIEGGKSI